MDVSSFLPNRDVVEPLRLQVLGLDAMDPAMAEVKKAFRRKVAKLHPDLKGLGCWHQPVSWDQKVA